MGTDLSTADEWVELMCVPTGSGLSPFDCAQGDIIIDGWYLTVVDSKKEEKTIFTFPASTSIGSGQYILVSNYSAEKSRLRAEPDYASTSIMLPNSKLLLRLYNASGTLIDLVDDGVGVPFAGTNASGTGSKHSMERLILSGSGSEKENWASAGTFLGFDDGAPLFGTPGFPNGTGPSEDMFAPTEATNLSASILSGTLISQWTPSVSLDLVRQEMIVSPSVESGRIILPVTATGWITKVGSGSQYELRLISIDRTGNVSSGVTVIAEEDTTDSNPEEESGAYIHPGVYITEVMANPKGKDDHEWIELGNLGTGAVSIAGWILDEGNSPDAYVIPTSQVGSGGFVLQSGEYVSFRKTVSGLPLGNQGEQLSLMSGETIIDSWNYPETAEEVSYGRNISGSGAFRSFCRPTEGAQNDVELLDPTIIIQSGETSGVGKVSINLIADVMTGSLASAECNWIYSDGFTSQSCNPPSHSFTDPGTHTVSLSVETFCDNTIERGLSVEVLAIASKAKKKKTGSSSSSAPEEVCTPTHSQNVIISEFLPNPYGDETEGEWVELQNIGNETVSLCGWLLDDEDGGSKPFRLEEVITPHQYLLLPRSQTKIALNNDADTVRLFAGSGNLIAEVTYVKGAEGETMGLREDGLFVWTPYPTPEEVNRFRGAERRFPTDIIIVSAVLPNPVGKDGEGEWVELANVSEEPFELNGWFLDNKEGGSAPYVLSGITLSPNEIRRFPIQETGLQLTNTADTARLLDPDNYIVSIIGWTEAVEGRIYRPPVFQGERVPARVVHVVDGDTIDIVLTDMDRLERIPGALKRQWLGIQNQKDPHIRVRLIGIDTPETVHPSKPVEKYGAQASEFTRALLEGENVELEFDVELYDKYERLLAYVFTEDGAMAQTELLRHGFAYAYLRFPFARQEEFVTYEKEAKQAQLGLWSNDAVQEIIHLQQQGVEEEVILEEVGLELSVDPQSGIVESGAVITFAPSLESDVYISVNSGAYKLLSGAFIVTEDVLIKAYAKRTILRDAPQCHPEENRSEASIRLEGRCGAPQDDTGTGTGFIRSEIVEVWYALERESYKQEVIFSEVYPSPVSSGSQLETEEWIEITNLTDQDVSLAGWIIDDVLDGGSKPHTLSADAVVPASGRLVLTGAQVRVSLNNDGDDLWLHSPDGSVEIGFSYPRVRKGRAYALMSKPSERKTCHGELCRSMACHKVSQFDSAHCDTLGALRSFHNTLWCLTDTPTPYEQNICTTIAPIKREYKKSKSKKTKPPGKFLWERYRNIVESGTGEAIIYPIVWQQLKSLEVEPAPQQKTSGEAEVLIITLMILPALRFLTL